MPYCLKSKYSSEKSFIVIHDEQVEEGIFFTPLESLDRGELVREDSHLNSESVRLEVFGCCHADVVNQLT